MFQPVNHHTGVDIYLGRGQGGYSEYSFQSLRISWTWTYADAVRKVFKKLERIPPERMPTVWEGVEFTRCIPSSCDLSQHSQITLQNEVTLEVNDPFCPLLLNLGRIQQKGQRNLVRLEPQCHCPQTLWQRETASLPLLPFVSSSFNTCKYLAKKSNSNF